MSTEGHCNCGKIKATVTIPLDHTVLCYCSNCRRSSAGLCSVNYAIDKSTLKIHDPEAVLKSYQDSNTASGNTITRQFCGNCGSPVVTLIGSDADKVFLKAGLFESTPEPAFEAFKKDKADWFRIPGLEGEK